LGDFLLQVGADLHRFLPENVVSFDGANYISSRCSEPEQGTASSMLNLGKTASSPDSSLEKTCHSGAG
jgi:hypothetical protein